jgi:arginase
MLKLGKARICGPFRDIVVIGAASGYGAQNPATQDAPEVLRRFDFLDQLKESGIAYQWDGIVHLEKPHATALDSVAAICSLLAEKTKKAIKGGHFPVVVGGDHSCAIGTWSGIKSAVDGLIGLIWIDAHMDSHTFSSSPSGAIHGMPLACLLGHGDERLTNIASPGAKLEAENVCLIGVRSFEEGEAKLLSSLGVRIFTMDEIRQRGIDEVAKEAFCIAEENTAGFGISIDLDALDPMEEPGVGSPVPGGLLRKELASALSRYRESGCLLGIEIVEYNPYLDSKFATAYAASELIEALVPHQSEERSLS